MSKAQGLRTEIDGATGNKLVSVANYALFGSSIGRNRTDEKQRQRTRGERDSGRKYSAGLMNQEITELAREEETLMYLPTTITQRPNPSTKSHEGVRWLALVFAFDLNCNHCRQRMDFKTAILTLVGETVTSFLEPKDVPRITINWCMIEMAVSVADFLGT